MKADGFLSGRYDAARNLLKPQQFRESIALAGQPSLEIRRLRDFRLRPRLRSRFHWSACRRGRI